MLLYNLEQGSEEWLKLRLGIPTTSNFGKIITPSGKPSSSMEGYTNKMIAELITGEGEPFFKSAAMQRGNELEPEAIEYYTYHTGRKTVEVGFITTNDGRVGCSPDRLVGKDGLVEVKCPMQTQHTINLISGAIDPKYIPQVQGQMWVTGRDWCDWISYHPDMPASIVRVERDEEYIEKLTENIHKLLDIVDKKIAILKDKGVKFKAELQVERDLT